MRGKSSEDSSTSPENSFMLRPTGQPEQAGGNSSQVDFGPQKPGAAWLQHQQLNISSPLSSSATVRPKNFSKQISAMWLSDLRPDLVNGISTLAQPHPVIIWAAEEDKM